MTSPAPDDRAREGAGAPETTARRPDAPRPVPEEVAPDPVAPGDTLTSEGTATPTPYDAFLLVGFGGPEGPDDVVPFLRNVTRGRGIPDSRLEEVGEHYYAFGGKSPINDQNRALLAAVEADFAANGLDLPVYWGNRNWDPYLTDTLRRMQADGVRSAVAFFTSAYSSWSGCRQYREDIARSRAEVGEGAPLVQKTRHYFNHPGFVAPMVEATRRALESIPAERREAAVVLHTAHSVPLSMTETAGPYGGAYDAQLVETMRLVTEGLEAAGLPAGAGGPRLVWQSRSGPPSQPWLEPDVVDVVEELAGQGVRDVVLVPIGFVSDHMEVLYDLDTEAAQRASELGVNLVRAATVGTDPRFVTMVRELVLEAADPARPRPALGGIGPSHRVCPVGCCKPGRAGLPGGPPVADS